MTQLRQGPWTDLYALGAVIHYLLFGAPPAPASARAVQDDAEAIENRIVPGVSPRFLEAVSWMLSVGRTSDRRTASSCAPCSTAAPRSRRAAAGDHDSSRTSPCRRARRSRSPSACAARADAPPEGRDGERRERHQTAHMRRTCRRRRCRRRARRAPCDDVQPDGARCRRRVRRSRRPSSIRRSAARAPAFPQTMPPNGGAPAPTPIRRNGRVPPGDPPPPMPPAGPSGAPLGQTNRRPRAAVRRTWRRGRRPSQDGRGDAGCQHRRHARRPGSSAGVVGCGHRGSGGPGSSHRKIRPAAIPLVGTASAGAPPTVSP